LILIQIRNLFNPISGIRGDGKIGSGINIPDRQYWSDVNKDFCDVQMCPFWSGSNTVCDGALNGFKLKLKVFPDNGADFTEILLLRKKEGPGWIRSKTYRYWIRIREAIKFQFVILLLLAL
jgi:hypothetical protein